MEGWRCKLNEGVLRELYHGKRVAHEEPCSHVFRNAQMTVLPTRAVCMPSTPSWHQNALHTGVGDTCVAWVVGWLFLQEEKACSFYHFAASNGAFAQDVLPLCSKDSVFPCVQQQELAISSFSISELERNGRSVFREHVAC